MIRKNGLIINVIGYFTHTCTKNILVAPRGRWKRDILVIWQCDGYVKKVGLLLEKVDYKQAVCEWWMVMF